MGLQQSWVGSSLASRPGSLPPAPRCNLAPPLHLSSAAPGSPGAPLASDRFGAAGASLGEELCKAVRTEGLLLSAGELLARQGGLTAGADKALLQWQHGGSEGE